jgi:very-short-patch-repair endonuclease
MRAKRNDFRVPLARRLRYEPTEAERVLWQRLRRQSMRAAHFRRQATIGKYIVDFACHSSRVVVELDGGHHEYGDQSLRDSARDAFLKANGYRVLRFWNNDVLQNIDGVLTIISSALEGQDNAPHP